MVQLVAEEIAAENAAENVALDIPPEDVFVFPTSYSQQRLWFLDQFEPNSPFYNIPSAVRIQGLLEYSALDRSIQEMIRRHESLRTTFAVMDNDPVQVVSPWMHLAVPRVDMEGLDPGAWEAEIKRLAVEEARQPFDLSRGPLLRARLLKRSDHEHVLLLTMHHIISDGWSMGVFIREVAHLYAAFTQGLPSPLPELPIQYGDFAVWQREWLQGEVLDAQLEYWKQRLGGQPSVLRLPTDRPRPAVYTSNGAKERWLLPRSIVEGLKDLGRQEGATLFMTLLAAFQALLYRYTGQVDISVGTAIANRNRGEIENVIGFFVNTLVMRTDLSGEPSFRQLLQRVREVALGAYAHQDLPFEQLVVQLNPERDMSHAPLFQVMLILQNTPIEEVKADVHGLSLESLKIDKKTSNFDLTLMVGESANGLNAILEYNTDLFDPPTVQRMLAHFQVLLEGAVADPDQSIATLPLLTEDERHQLLVEWNDTAAHYPGDLCIQGLFEQQVRQRPDAVAVVFEGAQLTYAALDRRANQLAHHLQRLGVGPEVLVGVCVERSLELIVSVLGILKAGGAYVPLDPNYPQERLAYMLGDSRAPVLLTQHKLIDELRISGWKSETSGFDPLSQANDLIVLCLDKDWDTIAQESQAAPDSHTTPENLAYTIYTSGSTGRAKGVMIRQSSLVNAYFAWQEAYGLGDTVNRHLQMASFSFDVFSGDLVRALCSGGTLVLCPFEHLLEPEKLYDLMIRESVECAEFVPAVLRNLIQHLAESEQPLGFMRVLIAGSDSWYAGEYQDFLRFRGPQTRLINSFGLTEATIDSTYFESSRLELPADRTVPIGRPYANQRVYILDAHMQPVPTGVYGEIYIGGAALARGFRNQPGQTAERYIPDPFSGEPGARLYKTGDLARYLADGNIEFSGRSDLQVKIRGLRIELGEVEAALTQHPGVRQGAAIVREEGSGDRYLVGYYVPAEDAVLPRSELRQFLLDRLPDYMVPSVFVEMKALPLTPNGKVDRKALPVPDSSQREQLEDYVPPRTQVEEILAGIWSRVLGTSRVSVFDNFFAIGGHSLLATQVNSRLRDSFRVELPLRNLFEYPTVASLAEKIEVALVDEAGLQAPPIRPIPRDRPLALSFAQERLWFLDQLAPGSPAYNVAETYRVSGPLLVPVLEQCLNEIVRRHEVLRTTFATVEARPVQIIAPELHLGLPVVDLADLSPAEQEMEVKRLAAEDAQQSFDLARGPLLRMRLLRLEETEHIVLFTIHHIISDDWSTFIYLREVAVLYEALASGKPVPLPDLSLQYADYAHWQRDWLQGEVLNTQLSYWRRQLSGAPPLLELSTDRPRPPVQTSRGASRSFTLSEELSVSMRDLSRQEGVTLFMTLLAAFQTLLYRYSGQEDISVGTPISNRTRSDLEGLIGFFVNTLVLRTDLSGNPGFLDLLKRVREVALGAFSHQDLPFERLVDELRPERDMSRTPLFQVMFVMQNIPRQSQEMERSELSFSSLQVDRKVAKFDLTLFMVEKGDRIDGTLNFNTDLFDESTIERMIAHFQNLLEGIASNPEQAISTLPLISSTERNMLLHEWNGKADSSPLDWCLHQRFEAQVERTPDAVAVAYEDEQLSYRELNRRANQLAHFLRRSGVGPEVFVGVCLERSVELMIALLGVLKAGGAYVPLDPGYPAERLTFMLQDSQAPILLTQQPLVDRLFNGDPQFSTSGVQLLCLDSDWGSIGGESDGNLINQVDRLNLAYMIYTSGSTGKPKGTLIHHQGLANYMNWCLSAYPLDSGRGSIVHSTIAFDATITALFCPLLSGLTVRMLPERIDLDMLADTLRRDRNYSLVKITPAHLDLLSHQLSPEEAATLTQAFVIGGENLLGEQIRFWQEHAPETHLFNEYGPTENVVGCIVYDAPLDGREPGSVPIGRAIPNTEAYILDRHFQPVPPGVLGELYLGGVAVARGYHNRPGLTADRFIPHPFSHEPGARLYKTGDVVRYLSDGNMEFLGRIDHQVKIRGYRVECGEVEAILSQHAGVRETVVLAREDIQGDKRLVAYCVPASGDGLPPYNELRDHLKKKLPEYMLPSFFIELEAIPLTPNGKVDRRALPEPDKTRPELEAVYVAPRTPVEEQVASIWAEVLGLEKVGIYDHFFELGGHSLLATQVISRVQQAFNVELPLRRVFESPTVAGLSESIDLTLWAAQSVQAPADSAGEGWEEGEI